MEAWSSAAVREHQGSPSGSPSRSSSLFTHTCHDTNLRPFVLRHESQEGGQVGELESHELLLHEVIDTDVVVVTVATQRNRNCVDKTSSRSEVIVINHIILNMFFSVFLPVSSRMMCSWIPSTVPSLRDDIVDCNSCTLEEKQEKIQSFVLNSLKN